MFDSNVDLICYEDEDAVAIIGGRSKKKIANALVEQRHRDNPKPPVRIEWE